MSQSVAQLIDAVWSSPSVGAVLLDATFKATVVLAAAGLAVLLVRKGSASGRHLVWSLAVLAALCLPLLALVLPSWRVEVVESAGARSPALRTEGPFAASARPRPSFEPARVRRYDWERPERVWRYELLPDAPPRSSHVRVLVTSMDPALSFASPSELDADGGAGVVGLLCALWATGAALLLARLAWGRFQVAALARSAHRVLDSRRTLARQLCAAIGVRRPVRLLESSDPVLPMTWGVLQPTVLLPDSSRSWSQERLSLVLLHELAHVRRLDALTQLFAQLACALYWFHPLVWLASRRMRSLREYACDDHVLSAGRRPSEYAGELLDMVRALGPRTRLAAATLPMAQRNELQERLMAILDPHVRRGGFSRWRGTLAGLAVAAVVLPLAAIQPAVAQPTPAPAAPKDKNLPRLSNSESKSRVGATPAPAAAPAPAPWPANAGPPPVAPGVPLPPAPPSPMVGPMAPVPPAPPVAPGRSWRHADDEDDDDDADDDDAYPHRQMIRNLKEDEQAAVDAIRRAEQRRSDDEILDGLEDVGRQFNLAAESTRKEFVRVADKLRGDSERSDALIALLKGAPITEQTGREVLRSAAAIRSDDAKLDVLKFMHRISESELVRGPLTGQYLDVAESLRGDDELSEALKGLLHPEPVAKEQVIRALRIAERIRDDDGRQAVLREVSDHQEIDKDVEAAYRTVMGGIRDGDTQRDTLERLTEAQQESRGHGGKHKRKNGFSFHFNCNNGDCQFASRDVAAAREQAERMREQAEREAERARDQAERESERERAQSERQAERERAQAERERAQAEREGQRERERAERDAERERARAEKEWKVEMKRFAEQQARLKTQAEELRRQAQALKAQMKERAKALKKDGQDFEAEIED